MRDLVFIVLLMMLLLLAVARPFVGIMLWSWISFMSVHRLNWGIAATMPWGMLTFAATAVGCLLAGEPKRPKINAMMIMMAIFVVGMTITSFTALSPDELVWSKWDRTFKSFVALLLTAALLTERWRIHALVWLIVISLGYFGVRGGMFTLMTGGGFRVMGPADTAIGDRNHIAVALLFAIPLMNWLRMHSKHQIIRYGLIAAMVLTLFGAIGTQSRGALVAMAAVAGMLWLRSPGKIVSGIAIVLSIVAVVSFMPQSWVDRMTTIERFEQDGSAQGRITIWFAAWDIAVARPLTGGGFRAVYTQPVVDRYSPGVRARATHSIYFEALGEHGFLMFGLWVAMIATGVFYSLRIQRMARKRPDLRWASDLARMSQVSMVAYLVGGIFLSLAYWDVFWTLMMVLGATHMMVKQAVREPVAAPSPVAVAAGGVGWRAKPAAP